MSKKNKKYMKEAKAEEAQEMKEAQEAKETNETIEPVSEEPGEPVEENASSEAGEAVTEEEKLLTALSEAEAKYNDLHDKYLRQMAEFENYRKRTLKEKSELILNGSAHLMTAVLPILDDMDRALEAMSKTEDAGNCRQGFELIANKFRTTLEQNGLREIEAKGEPFDTDYHEAIAMVPATDEMPKGQVIDCVQKGYKLNDRVIRHSKVVVAN
jgi:Molecular chaperone GrpE (heat shock protein)